MRQMIDYYPLALAEGEGAGTAYEYYVKARVIERIFTKTGTPKSLLIAGIPERYGFSLDFLVMAKELGCHKVTVMDERQKRLEQLKEVCRKLSDDNIFKCPDNLEIRNQLYPDENFQEFDFFISCEVLQRLAPVEQDYYWKQFLKKTKAGVVFTPNADNPDHATHSELKTVSLEQLLNLARVAGGEILDSGYLDMPPFPPGITRSDEQRESANQGGFYNLAFKCIEQWAKLEQFFSEKWCKKSAHIVYAAVRATCK